MRPLHNLLHDPNTALRGAQNAHVLRVHSAFSAPCLVFSSLATVVQRSLDAVVGLYEARYG